MFDKLVERLHDMRAAAIMMLAVPLLAGTLMYGLNLLFRLLMDWRGLSLALPTPWHVITHTDLATYAVVFNFGVALCFSVLRTEKESRSFFRLVGLMLALAGKCLETAQGHFTQISGSLFWSGLFVLAVTLAAGVLSWADRVYEDYPT